MAKKSTEKPIAYLDVIKIAFLSVVIYLFGAFAWLLLQDSLNQSLLEKLREPLMIIILLYIYVIPFAIAASAVRKNKSKNVLIVALAYILYFALMAGIMMVVDNPVSRDMYEYKEVEEEVLNQNPEEISHPLVADAPNRFLTPIEINSNKFTHQDLPGFEMTVLDGWTAKIKPFDDSENTNIPSVYRIDCSGLLCMHLTLEKGNTSLNLNFDKIMDNNGYFCRGAQANYSIVGNNWYRMGEGGLHIYTYKPDLNVSSADVQFVSEFTLLEETESFHESEVYSLCAQGHGYILQEQPSTSNQLFDYAIMMEFPIARGNPDETTLNEIDSMVASIKGLADY